MTKARVVPEKLRSREAKDRFIQRFDVFLFDCDGVLWSGQNLLPRVCETLDYLRVQGKKIIFVTNNSTKSRSMYQKKLKNMGINAELDEIFGSAYASAVYLSRILQFPKNKKVYVIGEQGIEDELRDEGISYCGGTDPADRRDMLPDDYHTVRPDPSVQAVLCGLDTHINYLKLSKAYQYLADPDCLFLLTNEDSTYPTSGTLFPGAGACSIPLSFATGRQGKALGKPNPEMLAAIEATFKFDKTRAVFVGDRLNTDIQFALNSGMGGSLLVLTGVSKEDEINRRDSPIVPDYYIDQLGDLIQNV